MYNVAQKTAFVSYSSIFHGSESSKETLTQKIIDALVIVFYLFDGKRFSEHLLETLPTC